MNWITVTCGIGAALFAAMAILFALRAYNGSKNARPRKVVYKRTAVAALCAAMMMVCLVGCSLGSNNATQSGTSTPGDTSQGDTSTPPKTTPPVTPPVEPLPEVNLTKNQIDAFLKDYDLTFDDSSLTSKVQERIAAWKAAGSEMTDGIAFPYGEDLLKELYDADFQKMVSNIKKLSGTEQVELFKAFRHEIYQDIISNPVIGIAWLELFSQNDLIMENNGYWITPNLEIIDQLYNGTYQQPKSTDAGYAEKMLIELNNLPEPTDVTCRGLDYLLVYNGGHIEVRQTWARLAVRICSVLEHFDVRGVTERSSTIHWHLLPTAEDSMVRPTKANYAESEPAIKLVYAQKDGKEAITYGSNLLDRRPMEYKPNVQEPPVTTPTTPGPGKGDPGEPDVPDPGKPDIPVIPKAEYGTLTIYYVDEAGKTVATTYQATLKVGATYNVQSPVVPGYTLVDQSQSVVRSSRYGTMIKSGRTITVVYRGGTTTSVDHTVYVSYVYEDGSAVYPSKSYTLKKGAAINEVAKPCPRNYWVSPESYSGVMGDSDVYVVFTYHYLPLENWKDPGKDPVNQGNADVGGGSNLPTDGPGDYQPTEPPRTDYPEQGSGGGTTSQPGSDRPDYNPDTGNSNKPLTPNDEHESSGQGGSALDHEIKDANGGHTDNGTPPAKDPINVDHGTTVTDPGGSSSSSGSSTNPGGSTSNSGSSGSTGTTTNTSDEPVNTGTIAEPD